MRAVKTELASKFPMNNTSYVKSLFSICETPFYAIFRDLQLYSTTGYICSTASISLRSKRFQSSYCAKVRAEAKKASVSNRVIVRKLERKQKNGSSFPSPSPVIRFFFCSCPGFLGEPREETLATQATHPWPSFAPVE